MTYKQWTAVIQLAGQAVITLWLVYEAMGQAAWPEAVPAAALKLLWAIGLMIAFNIAATIVVSILVGIVRGEELRDERADERDRAVRARSMRNAYFVVSIGGAITLVLLALGVDPALGAYALFAALMLGAAAESASLLFYYRAG